MNTQDQSRQQATLNTGDFIRHPPEIPLEITRLPDAQACGADVARFGGLAFDAAEPEKPGTQLLLRFPSLDPDFRAPARVAWCEATDTGYCIGVTFLDTEDAFRSRMLEQISAIKTYRSEVHQDDGKALTDNEAAREWIRQIGNRFPNP